MLYYVFVIMQANLEPKVNIYNKKCKFASLNYFNN